MRWAARLAQLNGTGLSSVTLQVASRVDMDKTSSKRLSVKSVAHSVGLPLVCLLIGLCGGCLPKNGVYSGWFQNLSDARFAALTGILGTALGAIIAFGGVLLSKRADRRTKQIERQEAYRQGQLVDPVVEGVDTVLKFLDQFYAVTPVDGNRISACEFEDLKSTHIEILQRAGALQARLLALGDETLIAEFDIMIKQVEFGTLSQDCDQRVKMKDAIDIAVRSAGRILAKIGPQAPG